MMLQDLVYTQLQNALAAIGAAPDTLAPFEIPRQQGFGHLSTTVAMSLARELRKPPRAIAQELINHMGQIPMVDKIEIAGAGFINVTFAPAAFHAVLQDLEKKGDDIGRSAIGKGLKVNVEYVSANPTGPLHAGHGRNCALGDTIANVLEWTGHEVTREYYFNNAGNQMNKLGLSIAARVCDLLGRAEVLPFPEDGYHGEYIVTIAELLLSTEKTELEQLVEQSDLETLQTRCRKDGVVDLDSWHDLSVQSHRKHRGFWSLCFLWLFKLCFVCCDFFIEAHDVTEFIHAIEQTSFIECVDREGKRTSGEGNGLGGKVNCQFGTRRFFHQVKEHLMSLFIYNDGDESILQ